MNFKVRFQDAAQRASKRVSEYTLDNSLPEREDYLSDCNDTLTDNPLIKATEANMRAKFGVGQRQESLHLAPLKKWGRVVKETGLVIEARESQIPGGCMRFSLVFDHTEMHAVIKTARTGKIPHLDALQVILDGDQPIDVPCGSAGVQKSYLEGVIKYFRKAALELQAFPETDKSVLEQNLRSNLEGLPNNIILSTVRLASPKYPQEASSFELKL